MYTSILGISQFYLCQKRVNAYTYVVMCIVRQHFTLEVTCVTTQKNIFSNPDDSFRMRDAKLQTFANRKLYTAQLIRGITDSISRDAMQNTSCNFHTPDGKRDTCKGITIRMVISTVNKHVRCKI